MGGDAPVRAGGLWEIFVASPQFCCETKTALKNKVFKNEGGNRDFFKQAKLKEFIIRGMNYKKCKRNFFERKENNDHMEIWTTQKNKENSENSTKKTTRFRNAQRT